MKVTEIITEDSSFAKGVADDIADFVMGKDTMDSLKRIRKSETMSKDEKNKAAAEFWNQQLTPKTKGDLQPDVKDVEKELYKEDTQQDIDEGETWAKHNNPRAGGMSKKSVKSYRRSNPGSKIQTAVTTKPSKLKKGSKAAKRRKSFCARMKGMKKSRTSAKTARDPNSNINKSLRRWNCESIEQMQELVMIAEQFISKHKK